MDLPLRDRRDAGRRLAELLADLRGRDDLLVLGLPRGGLPVAYEIAVALEAPLDVFVVRKLGVPGHEELAMGAIATGGVRVLNEDVVAEAQIRRETIDAVAATERQELARRERLYRGARPPLEVRGRTVILVDDGLATGSTMRAAVAAVSQLQAHAIVVAVPVAAPTVCRSFEPIVDRIVCGATPHPFFAVGPWYVDFSQTTDDEVRSLLVEAERRPGIATPSRPAGVELPAVLGARVQPLTSHPSDYDALLDEIGEARLVLIGEATHGSHEFYQERATISRRLIEERGFGAVAVEADWPDAFRVNRYVRDRSGDRTPETALGDFERFPQWMWRNTVVRDFVAWLREHNRGRAAERQAGFYGLDLYSLNASIQAVIGYLDTVDPAAAARARSRYGCFDHFHDDAQAYGYATSMGTAEPCEDDVVEQLLELQRRAADLARQDGHVAEDEFFSAEMNARLAKNAEAYYRSMFRGRVSSWNLRDTHMADTLDALIAHLDRTTAPSKIVVWAHNSHLGDARATQMGEADELNLGQLVRERHGATVFLLGQTTHHGTVTAASDWGGSAERKRVRPGMTGSYEALFHEVEHPAFYLPLRDADVGARLGSRQERAIGVIYRPETERWSHYFGARLGEQFDAVLHFDETSALIPLERTPGWDRGEAPATYPSGDEPPLPGRG